MTTKNMEDQLVRQDHLLRAGLQELALERSMKEGGTGQNILVSSEKTLLTTHNHGDYGAGERAVE
mgnify:CR=1 FL=1